MILTLGKHEYTALGLSCPNIRIWCYGAEIPDNQLLECAEAVERHIPDNAGSARPYKRLVQKLRGAA